MPTLSGSDNGLLPVQHQAIIWTNTVILSIRLYGTYFSEILLEIRNSYSRKCTWKCRLKNGCHFVSASMCQLIGALWHHMATEICVTIGSGNGLLPDGTKPLPEPMSTYHQQGWVTFISGQVHKRYHQSIIWKIKYLKCRSNFPGANELKKTCQT